MTLSKIDQAIATVKFILKKRKKNAEQIGQRLDLNENQKIFIGQEFELIKNVEFLITQCKQDINAQLGKIPPQAVDIEPQIIGACMLFAVPPDSDVLNPVIPRDRIKSFLKPEHFYAAAHQEIYQAILDTPTPSLINVIQKLRKEGKVELVGGQTYVASLHAQAGSSVDIEYHARVLVEMAIKRQLIMLGGEMLQKGYDDTVDCFDLLEDSEKEFIKVRGWIK